MHPVVGDLMRPRLPVDRGERAAPRQPRHGMRALRTILGCLGLTIAAVHVVASAPPQAAAADDVRAVWVLRTTLTSAESVRAMVRTVSAAGFNTILLQVRGRGEAYYKSQVDPRAAELAQGFDPLALAIELAHEAGLSVHAWVNVNLVASPVNLPRSPTHVARRHPEWLMVPKALAANLGRSDPTSTAYLTALARWTRRQSDSVEGVYLSPASRDAQAYTVSVIDELVRAYSLDGVHLDYIRYPGESFDYSAAALAEFRAARLPHTTTDERDRLDAAARRDPTAWTTHLPQSWAEFRRERLTELVSRIGEAIAVARPGVLMTAAVVPDASEARGGKGQDWQLWARTGLLDAVCPMAYATDPVRFSAQVAGVRDVIGDVPMWAGIGAYRLTAREASAHVRLARQSGAAGVALFSYDSVAGERDGGARYFGQLREALVSSSSPSTAR